LAGWGDGKDPQDGYFIGGGFDDPRGLAVAPDGSLLVADHDGNRLRRVSARAGAGVVSTLDVELKGPKAVAVGADGTIYLIQDEDPNLRFLKPRN
jgi:glucose/arabinose dehydrogenase